MKRSGTNGNKRAEILCHQIGYSYKDGFRGTMDDVDEEHIQKMIKEGCREGELATKDPRRQELTHYGWWSIITPAKQQQIHAVVHCGEVAVIDPDSKAQVHLSVYKDQASGGMFAIDSSFIEQTDGSTITSPFNPDIAFNIEQM